MAKELSASTIQEAKDEAVRIRMLCKFGILLWYGEGYSLGQKVFESTYWEFFEVLDTGKPSSIHIRKKPEHEGLLDSIGWESMKRLSEGKLEGYDELAQKETEIDRDSVIFLV